MFADGGNDWIWMELEARLYKRHSYISAEQIIPFPDYVPQNDLVAYWKR